MAGLTAARRSDGSEFHAAGPACEKARSPNLVQAPLHPAQDTMALYKCCIIIIILSRGVTYLLLEADCRPVRVAGRTNDVFETHRAFCRCILRT